MFVSLTGHVLLASVVNCIELVSPVGAPDGHHTDLNLATGLVYDLVTSVDNFNK